MFARYAEDREELGRVAAIRTSVENSDARESVLLPEPDEDENECLEGKLLYRRHRSRERDPRVAKRKKEQVLGLTGRLACEACGMDFGERYGELGEGFIECHHVIPLSEGTERVTKLKELALLCSNCHRMIHRATPMLAVDTLRDRFR